MRDTHQIQFTFNSEKLGDCILTKSASYSSADEAITDLISEFNLIYRKEGNIFIILPKEENAQTKQKTQAQWHLFSGVINDAGNGETLPSAIIRYDDKYIMTDATGFFSFKSVDSIAKLEIRYLGYAKKDTLLAHSKHHAIKLKIAGVELEEVLVSSNSPIFGMHSGREAANVRLNHRISRFLPGNIDNGIYNMLRLQPGIMASGEQTNDYTIWGSYPGQSLVEYDHIRLFSISSFDDNQSIVHPLMTKEIEIIKGGFSTEYGDATGGIVNITGKNGDVKDFHGNANINNQAVSGYLNIPISNRFALQTAYRQTFNNILNWEIESKSKKGDIEYFQPKTSFNDFNVKFSGNTNQKDHFYINILASNDDYDYTYTSNLRKFFSEQSLKTRNQTGVSAVYNQFFKQGSYSTTIFSYSELITENDYSREYRNPDSTNENFTVNSQTSNKISELSIEHAHLFPAKGIHRFSLAAEFTGNTASYQNDTGYFNAKGFTANNSRLGFYADDKLSLFGKLNIKAGIRADYLPKNKQIYFQPRLNVNLDISRKLKINAAVGKYNQFLNKSPIYSNNYTVFDIWEIIDTEKQEATSAVHYTMGFSFINTLFRINVEGFYKKIDNIYAFHTTKNEKELIRIKGNAKITGIDFYLKTKLGKHEIWVAYTLSETLEHYNSFWTNEYKPAPHNQTHEIKGASVLNFSPFYFSANYVYGSGLQLTRRMSSGTPLPYNRFDVSAMYKININKVYCQLGLSVLNVFNTFNAKYNNTISLPDERLVYSQSIPFSVLLNLYVGF